MTKLIDSGAVTSLQIFVEIEVCYGYSNLRFEEENMTEKNLAAMPIVVPGNKKDALRALVEPPVLAWPTVCMWVVAMIVIPGSDWLALQGHLPLWGACIINVVAIYPLFGVAHDATHRAISSIPALNDWIGRIALLLFAPQVGIGVFRWAHMQHHRFTNGTKDPDQWIHGAWWTLLFRWATFDLYYIYFIVTCGDKVAMKQLRGTLFPAVMTILAVIVLVNAGYGREVLWLWFIPARITMTIFGCVFFWLPHVKHDVSAQDNLTLASSMRFGHEWLFNIVLQFHNYHLIHHLWPSTPPYNHVKVWQLMKDEIQQRDLQVQYGFDIKPTVHVAGQGA